MIKKENGKYSVWSEDGKKRLGKPGSKAQAVKRLKEIEYFKRADKSISKGEGGGTYVSDLGQPDRYAMFLSRGKLVKSGYEQWRKGIK
jgi:hypothetical protein